MAGDFIMLSSSVVPSIFFLFLLRLSSPSVSFVFFLGVLGLRHHGGVDLTLSGLDLRRIVNGGVDERFLWSFVEAVV